MRPISKAVFLDRDGTLIRDKKYAFRPAEIELLDGVVAGLKLLQQADYRLIVITNQSGVARGFFKEEDVKAMHRRLSEMLLQEGIRISGFYYCPHHPDGCLPEYTFRCDCRKPEPGLILRASLERSIALSDSWLVGDFLTDVKAGLAAGCNTVLIREDLRTIEDPSLLPTTLVAKNFMDAVRIILSHGSGESDVQHHRHRAKIQSGASARSWRRPAR